VTPQQLAYRAAHYTPWYSRIGDGGAIGWLTAAAYVAAALLCLRAGGTEPETARPARMLWRAVGAALLVLGINKQLDLQIALIEFWREIALAYGWYGTRRTVQYAAFALGLLGGGVVALWLLPKVRRQSAELRAAFAGTALIGVYVVLRAAKFQHVLWSTPVAPKGPGWLALVELGGIAVVAGAAWLYARRGGGQR
jgi:hypothetical protein